MARCLQHAQFAKKGFRVILIIKRWQEKSDMLRRTNLFYRSALLLQPVGLSLRECCLLWNWYETKILFSDQEEQEYCAISQTQESAFLAAVEQIKAFRGIKVYENIIDYLLGAFLLFPSLQRIPQDYWLAPISWH